MEGQDCLALPHIEPMVTGDEPVVVVHLPVPCLPVVELAHADSEPPYQLLGREFRPLAPPTDVINHFIPHVVRYPAPV
jgi:hypothetical protein